MAEELKITVGSKEEKYRELVPQIKAVVEGETDLIANMANVASMLQETFGFWWTGFYRVTEGILVLGPFQGPLACTRIKKGKGVCGTAWEREGTVIVPDVEQFPGHIACSSLSRSEIVVPVKRNGEVIAVLDIDSKDLNTFDEIDKKYLEEVAKAL
ncbi:MAG: GAF domain-containing protein [Bacteroidaceae bacterium]|nr:GAF domain-containing protein [Bacteroidaceae bacterium]